MTVAVCLKCGVMKHGAFTPCPKCHYVPTEAEDKAKYVMATDHYLSQADLEQISQRVQTGLPVQFEPKQVEELVNTIKEMDAEPKNKRRMLMTVLTGTAVVILPIVGLIGLVWWFLK